MYQPHSQPKQQQYITLLDKCTQILRQDRIWLRNMVKAGHQQAINLFRGLPKNVDMKQLQIKLRKYIMRAKQREKQQQLQRFKENMQLPDFVQLAAEKRQHQFEVPTKSQQQYNNQNRRGPLLQNESNHMQERSSFVAKWNNYSHYNNPPTTNSNSSQQLYNGNYRQNNNNSQHAQQQPTRQLQPQQSTSQQQRPVTTSSSKRQWQNNYKPHSFNKNLNYELANKLSLKNSSNTMMNNNNVGQSSLTSGMKSRQNLSTTSLNKSNNIRDNGNSINYNRSMMMTTMMGANNNNIMTKNSSNNNNRRMSSGNDDLEESGRFANINNTATRTSSKSLKQLQNRIYQQLKLFQQNNKIKRQSQSLNKSYSQRSIQKLINNNNNNDKEKSIKKSNHNVNNNYNNNNFSYSNKNSRDLSPQQQQQHIANIPSTKQVSKQCIDEILKFKLGNCDFQTYKKQQSFVHQEQQSSIDNHSHSHNQYGYGDSQYSNISQLSNHHSSTYDSKIPTSSQKKLYYNDSMFPPIQEQTQRDSQSQRYPQQPLRFGQVNNPTNALRQQIEDRQKMVFASFAKGASSPLQNQLILSKNQGQQQQSCDDMRMLDSFNPQHMQAINNNNNNNLPITINNEPISHRKKISQSLYQSAQKKNDFNENFVQSDLHKSIMQSIKKSRQMYPLEGDNVINQTTHSQIPYRPATSQVTSFSSSLYASSNHNNQTIFTSPELLNQCRIFLKKTQQINFQNSGLGSNFTSSLKNTRFESPTSSQQKKSLNFQMQGKNINNNNQHQNIMFNFPQPITITQSITKDYYEHYGDSNFSQAKINSMFESKQSSVQKNIMFQTYSKPQEMIQRSLESNAYRQEEKGSVYESSMKNSVNEGNYLNNSNSMKPKLSSAKKEQPFIVGHSRKNSSIKRHSQIQQTLISTTQPPTTMQFNLTTTNQPQIQNNYIYPQQHDENYRTSQFKQVQQQNNQHSNTKQQYHDDKELYEMIEMEEIIDRLLEANEGNLELDSTWLKHTIANHCIFQTPIARCLEHLLHEFIIQPEQTHNFIDLLDVLYAYYRTQCPNYRPRKSPAADVYSLLDIEDKGYIVQEDLQNFICQLQSAGVQNIDEISHNLQQTFQMADFLSIKKISYVNLYVIKNEDCFDALWADLQQFEFEVEGEQ